jgi:hypothetical protein
MAAFRALSLAVLAAVSLAVRQNSKEQSLLQTWDKAMDTPVTRVVKLLEEMTKTLTKDMEEDEDLYKKLSCWCNNNEYEKTEAIESGETKIAELQSTIESSTSRSASLKTRIKELNENVASDKAALAEAQSQRDKELQEFHGGEMDAIQAIEGLKAALVVLGKHHEPKSTNWHAFVSLRSSTRGDLSAEDDAVVQKAFKSATAFLQGRGESTEEGPTYNAQSGQIVGIMKQMKEEMETELAKSQKLENERAAAFAEMREAKTAEIESGEKNAELKEDELANTDNALAEAKEDLGQEQAALAENQKFSKNLKEICADAEKNFDERKKARMQEITAVAETITILTEDEARDAAAGTYNFVQVASTGKSRRTAAALLRRAAARSQDKTLYALASSVELDAFTRVKKAITDMIEALTTQQADEVKKKDWCTEELQANEMKTLKTEDHKKDLQAKEAELEDTIKTLESEVEAAKAQISQMQVDLQRASEDRVKENLDFQKTVADQTMTIEVLLKALDRLATFYDKESLLQISAHRQTPPVPQMEYKPSKGAGGVMQMIEKLVYEAKALVAESRKSEGEAQAAYEEIVASTNSGVAELQKEVVTKTKQKAKATKEKQQTSEDIIDTVGELEDLSKMNADLHGECDYVLKNFMIRQKARAQEIEALQNAMQILNRADLA